MSGNFMKEIVDLSEQLKGCGINLGDLRRFAITRTEAREFIEVTMSDQPVPPRGTKCELMGVRCIVVTDYN